MYFNVSYAIHTDINLIVQLINIFIMKNLPKTFLGALALACISLASCSSDEPMQQKNGEESGFRPRSTKFVNAKAAYFGGNFVYL
jgi:hypothetical protein